jgi:hypothetical protein
MADGWENAQAVTSYGFVWSVGNGKGTVSLKLANGTVKQLTVGSLGELAGYAAILNEQPVAWDDDSQRLGTGWEPTGGT